VWGLAKEITAAIADFRPIVVGGAPTPAAELRRKLTEDGAPEAVRDVSGRPLERYDVDGAELLVYLVEGDHVSGDDEQALRTASRHRIETVCVLVGGSEPANVPYVLESDVISVPAGAPLPVERIVGRIAERAGERDFVLASKLPRLRRAVAERIVRRFSRQNGMLGAAIFLPGADLPVLTLNQLRMVFRIAGAYGEELDRERAVELVGVVGAGVGFRALARQAAGFIPGPGWALKGGIAYAGTRALGETAIRYFEVRARPR
jgi:uncharacterized protein (DUF697 family)